MTRRIRAMENALSPPVETVAQAMGIRVEPLLRSVADGTGIIPSHPYGPECKAGDLAWRSTACRIRAWRRRRLDP